MASFLDGEIMHDEKHWSTWIEVPFDKAGHVNTTPLTRVPAAAGVYAIASKKSNGFYVTHYVGRSCRSMRERLQRHMGGRGNKVVASELALRKNEDWAKLLSKYPPARNSMWIAYLKTSEPKIVEAVYLDTRDLPVCNLIKARLPFGLSESLVFRAQLE